jgi:hypothetical protein
MFGVIVAGKTLFGFDCRGAAKVGFLRQNYVLIVTNPRRGFRCSARIGYFL